MTPQETITTVLLGAVAVLVALCALIWMIAILVIGLLWLRKLLRAKKQARAEFDAVASDLAPKPRKFKL